MTSKSQIPMPLPETNPEFEPLLDYLKCYRGCDLTVYKRATLMRRFDHRMRRLGIEGYQHYLQYLQGHPEEHLALLQDVLINFTGFFRDLDAWVYLATEIIPQIIVNKHANEPIRVWSAGCSTGQEIYSFLILMSEILGIEFCLQHLQCYATDTDKDALRQAEKAIYSDLEVSGISSDLLEKYFQRLEQGYGFHPELHRLIHFEQHNLIQDAPIPTIDLLICRNVLMYFTVEAQGLLLARFHVALKNTGFLFLGQAEMLVHHRQFFTPVNLKQRFYHKEFHLDFESSSVAADKNHFWQIVFKLSPVAQLILDHNGDLISANQQAMLLFGLTFNDLKRCFQKFESGKITDFKSLVKYFHHDYPTTLKSIKWLTPEGKRFFDIEIVPIFNTQNQQFENIVTFLEITNYKQLEKKLEHSNSEIEELSKQSKAIKLGRLYSSLFIEESSRKPST